MTQSMFQQISTSLRVHTIHVREVVFPQYRRRHRDISQGTVEKSSDIHTFRPPHPPNSPRRYVMYALVGMIGYQRILKSLYFNSSML